MAQQTVNLGTLADGSDGDTNKVAWSKAKDNFAELYGRIVGKGYISGLQMKWVSGTALTITSGSAYIEGTSAVLYAAADIAKTGLSLSASAWYHVYVYDNAGTPDFVLSTTAPASPYNGTARSMTGDTSKRYAGSVKTDVGGNLFSFLMSGNQVSYREDVSSGVFRPLTAGTATTGASVSCSAVIPLTARIGMINFINAAASGGSVRSGTSDDNFASTGNPGLILVRSLATAFIVHPLDSSQAFLYWFDSAPSGGGLYINVLGYTFER